ncbi:MAG TPA: tRNA pseudouridine(13) synthase TruD [Trueperaceae bacterium]|nr:tRNA pseudouridine(13) synthase TruD [Trueperaceae bacterium]
MSDLPEPDPGALCFAWEALPAATADLPGTGGRIRVTPEDFRVEEVPAYLPQGSGSHLYLRVEKRNLTTRDLVAALLAAGVEERQIGVAGLKDKSAVTVQWLSLPKRFQAAAVALEALPGVRVLERSYHRNKLGIGHLHGNRFIVTIREPEGGPGPAERRARAVVEALAERGVPNYFGPQRFGRYGANAVDGLRVLRGEKVPGGHRLKRFFVSALQSHVVNAVLAERIRRGLYTAVVSGDWARKHDTGGVFLVEDAARESPRAERLEISATLPLYGRRVRVSEGEAGEIEREVLERYGLPWSAFGSRRGDRRPSRVLLEDVAFVPLSDGLQVAFTLRKGSYATVVLREVMKVDVDAPLARPATGGGEDGRVSSEDEDEDENQAYDDA